MILLPSFSSVKKPFFLDWLTIAVEVLLSLKCRKPLGHSVASHKIRILNDILEITSSFALNYLQFGVFKHKAPVDTCVRL